jgi:hypothetical protein
MLESGPSQDNKTQETRGYINMILAEFEPTCGPRPRVHDKRVSQSEFHKYVAQSI